MSEICITSSSAATRGIRFLPEVVAGASRCGISLGEPDEERGDILGQPMA